MAMKGVTTHVAHSHSLHRMEALAYYEQCLQSLENIPNDFLAPAGPLHLELVLLRAPGPIVASWDLFLNRSVALYDVPATIEAKGVHQLALHVRHLNHVRMITAEIPFDAGNASEGNSSLWICPGVQLRLSVVRTQNQRFVQFTGLYVNTTAGFLSANYLSEILQRRPKRGDSSSVGAFLEAWRFFEMFQREKIMQQLSAVRNLDDDHAVVQDAMVCLSAPISVIQ